MSSTPEEKEKRRYRRRSRTKDLKTPKYRQRIVEDKHGNKHDLSTMTHRDLIEAIQETE